ncbi:MAG: TRAP transporter TatT component family protein, partial [Thermodesulfobacteriota bacterium]
MQEKIHNIETDKKYFSLLFTLFFISILFSACSPKRYLKNYVLGSFSNVADLYMTEGDLQLVRESMPATLKLLEALIAQSPDNPDLLVSAAQGFTVYAYAFVHQDAERIMMTDIKKSIQLKKRAHRLYLRAKSYAF